MGIAGVYTAVHKITRYNAAIHDTFGKQNELVRTLLTAMKTQDKLIRKLTKRVDRLETKLAKKPGTGTKVKKAGWFG